MSRAYNRPTETLTQATYRLFNGHALMSQRYQNSCTTAKDSENDILLKTSIVLGDSTGIETSSLQTLKRKYHTGKS